MDNIAEMQPLQPFQCLDNIGLGLCRRNNPGRSLNPIRLADEGTDRVGKIFEDYKGLPVMNIAVKDLCDVVMLYPPHDTGLFQKNFLEPLLPYQLGKYLVSRLENFYSHQPSRYRGSGLVNRRHGTPPEPPGNLVPAYPVHFYLSLNA